MEDLFWSQRCKEAGSRCTAHPVASAYPDNKIPGDLKGSHYYSPSLFPWWTEERNRRFDFGIYFGVWNFLKSAIREKETSHSNIWTLEKIPRERGKGKQPPAQPLVSSALSHLSHPPYQPTLPGTWNLWLKDHCHITSKIINHPSFWNPPKFTHSALTFLNPLITFFLWAPSLNGVGEGWMHAELAFIFWSNFIFGYLFIINIQFIFWSNEAPPNNWTLGSDWLFYLFFPSKSLTSSPPEPDKTLIMGLGPIGLKESP